MGRVPVGFVWGEADGEVLLHPDETVVTAIRTIFARFAETGSARRVWLWFRDQGLQLPLQMSAHAEIRWVEASYHAIHQVLSNPVYAGAYVYGKTRTEMTLEPLCGRSGDDFHSVGELHTCDQLWEASNNWLRVEVVRVSFVRTLFCGAASATVSNMGRRSASE